MTPVSMAQDYLPCVVERGRPSAGEVWVRGGGLARQEGLPAPPLSPHLHRHRHLHQTQGQR